MGQRVRGFGFADVTPPTAPLEWRGILIGPREGSHGLGPVTQKMGPVIGLSLSAPSEPSIYWAGDTVLYPPVERIIAETKPDIIVIHACGARRDGDLIVMDAAEAVKVCEAAPQALVIATHMEALDHATVTRAELRAFASARGVTGERLRVPEDGEAVEFDWHR